MHRNKDRRHINNKNMITKHTNKQAGKRTNKQTSIKNNKQHKQTIHQANVYMYSSNSRQ